MTGSDAAGLAALGIDIGGTKVAGGVVAPDGAILSPRSAAARGRPVLLEVKGVSWNFNPLTLPGGSTALRVLGNDAGLIGAADLARRP